MVESSVGPVEVGARADDDRVSNADCRLSLFLITVCKYCF